MKLRTSFRPGSLSVALFTGFVIAAGAQVLSNNDVSIMKLFASESAAPQGAPPLLMAHNLVYQGAFRIPVGAPYDDAHSANYGGGCLSYNPAGNGGQGSLLVCGLNIAKTVGEISVPTPGIASSVSGLPTATLVNNFTDVLQGHVADIYGPTEGSSVEIGGLLVHNGKLIVSVYGVFDTNVWNHPKSHFLASANLASPAFLGGPYQVGDPAMPGFVAGFMTPIPAAYRGLFGGPYLTGQCCLNIIGRTSSGPSATVFNPDHIGQTNPAPATRLLGYPLAHPTIGDWSGLGSTVGAPLYNGASRSAGGVFPEGSRSVLFFGRLGVGKFCYGQATSDPSLAGQQYEPGVVYCYDPTSGSKGSTAYPYKFMVWAYDANDLAAVKAGSKKDYEIVPYATWELTLPILYPAGPGAHYSIGGVAYDPGSQRIFVAQQNVDAAGATIINVFSVQGAATSTGLCR